MLRFLRQYNKWILAVGGTLLLVSWALSGMISSMSQSAAQSGSTWATHGRSNTKVTYAELEEIRRELRVLDVLDTIVRSANPNQQLLPVAGAVREPAHWLLLTKEAAEAGLVGGLNSVDSFFGPASNGEDADSAVALVAARSGTSPQIVRRTVAKLIGVGRLLDLVGGLPRYSDARIEQAASEGLLGIGGTVVTLDARLLSTPAVPPPDEVALARQLELYGDVVRGQGPEGFGYRLPDQLKIEWLHVPQEHVRDLVSRSDALQPIALKKHFASDPQRFGAPPPAPGSDPLALFPAFESQVRQRVLDDLVTERMNDIAKFASDQLAIAQRGIPRDGAFLRLPDNWSERALDLRDLSQAIGEQYKIPFPVYASLGDRWVSINDVVAIPGLGTASTMRFGTDPVRLGTLLGGLREFGRSDDTRPMQVMVATPPLTADNGDIFIARVLDADPARAPRSIEEAGPNLITDLEAIERYQALREMAPELRMQAITEGPRAVADRFGTTAQFVARFQEADQGMLNMGVKWPSPLPGLGQHPETVKAIAREANRLPKTMLAGELPVEERTIIVPVDDRMAYVIVRIEELYPLTREAYRVLSRNPQAQLALAGDATGNPIETTFSLPELMRRHGFTFSREMTDDES